MNKTKFAVWLVAFLAIGLGIGSFIFTHNFKWKSPILLQKPLTITKKTYQIITTIVKAEGNTDVDPLTPDQRYACNLFGKDCVTAVAIMRAESHYRPNAINRNNDGSWDFGCFQINSVHIPKIDTSKYNLLNCKDNTDIAYTIYKQQGNFSAWSAYNNGSYKQYLINK